MRSLALVVLLAAVAAAAPGEITESGPVPEPVPLPAALYGKVHAHVYDRCEVVTDSGQCCVGGTVPLKNDPRSVSGCMMIRELPQEGEFRQTVLRQEIVSFTMGLREPLPESPDSERVLFFDISADGKLNFAEQQIQSPATSPEFPDMPETTILPPDAALVEKWRKTAEALLLVLPRKEI